MLDLLVHRDALGLIKLAAGLDHQLVHARDVDHGVVPRRVGQVRDGQDQVLHRTGTPVATAERLLVPDLAPVAVLGFAHDVRLQADLLPVLGEELRREHCPTVGGVRGAHVELRALETRLLQVVPRLVEIVGDGQIRVVARELRAEGLIVADDAVAEQDLVDELLARRGVLEREPEVVVVERRHVRAHRVGEREVARHVDDLHTGDALQPRDGLQVGAVDDVDGAADERVHARGVVQNRQDLDRVHEAGFARLPGVRVALQGRTHPGVELAQEVAARPFPGMQVRLTVHRRHHAEVVVGEEERQVGVGVGDFHHHGVVTIDADIADPREHALGRGLGLLAAVHVDGVDDVFRGQAFPVGELDTLAELEAPDLRVGTGFPAFREVRGRPPVDADIDETVADGPADDDHRGRVVLGGVQRVDRVRVVQAATQVTADPGGVGQRPPGPQGARGRQRQAHGTRVAEEFAPREMLVSEHALELDSFLHHFLLSRIDDRARLSLAGPSTLSWRRRGCRIGDKWR